VSKQKTTKPPAVRGVRGQKVIDKQAGLRELIDSWMLEQPRPTYSEMIDRIKATGYYLKRSTLARYGFEFEFKRREIAQIVNQARILGQDEPDSVLELERSIANLANAKIFLNLLDPEKNPIDEVQREVMTVASRIQSSASSRERARLAHQRGVKAATQLIKAELEQLLKDDPAALKILLRKIDQAAERVAEAKR
jgi:hypothetical protein